MYSADKSAATETENHFHFSVSEFKILIINILKV
jgi:hypothetical protein